MSLYFFLIKLSSILVVNVLWHVGGAPHGNELKNSSFLNVTLDQNPKVQLIHKAKGVEDGFLKTNMLWKSENNKSLSDFHCTKDPIDLPNKISEPRAMEKVQEQHREKEMAKRPKVKSKEEENLLASDVDIKSTITFDKEYTAKDIAEYIFWTGDERSIAIAINDLINDGLMLSKDDTINFLESVESQLSYLKNRYQTFLSQTSQQKTSISPATVNPITIV